MLALVTEIELHNTICIPNQNLMNFNNSALIINDQSSWFYNSNILDLDVLDITGKEASFMSIFFPTS